MGRKVLEAKQGEEASTHMGDQVRVRKQTKKKNKSEEGVLQRDSPEKVA